MTKAALDHLGPGSAIVNTTSITAYQGYPKMVDYSPTRRAIVAFTRSMAAALVEKRIRVTPVAPPPTCTPLNPASSDAHPDPSHGPCATTPPPGTPHKVPSYNTFLAQQESPTT